MNLLSDVFGQFFPQPIHAQDCCDHRMTYISQIIVIIDWAFHFYVFDFVIDICCGFLRKLKIKIQTLCYYIGGPTRILAGSYIFNIIHGEKINVLSNWVI